jgi:hypothetical protein
MLGIHDTIFPYHLFMKKFLLLALPLLLLTACWHTIESVPVVPTIIVPEVAVQQSEETVVNTFFSFVPPVQPSITGTREENNKVLWKHLDNSSNAFYIDDYDYIKLFLKEELSCNRDILLGINGKSVGAIHKNNTCSFVSNNIEWDYSVFRFSVDSIEVVGNWEKRVINLRDYVTEEWVVYLSFAVWQTDNYVTLIEIE